MSDPSCDILYVITDLDLGGVPLHLHRLACAMQERGMSVRAVSLAPAGPVGQMLADAGIPVESCQGRSGFDLRVVGRLARVIRRRRPRIVHALLFHANLAARWAVRRAGLPRDRLICEIQTVEIERRWHLWVDRWTHHRCRFTIGNSPSVIEHLHRLAHIPKDRLRLVRGGIDPRAVRQAKPIDRAAVGLGSHDRVVLWAGRLDPIKGLDNLIRAMILIDSPDPVSLLLAGEGPMRDRLEQLARTVGQAKRVRFLGPRRDVPGLLHIADVFAFPSRTEGLPNALLEAMAAGCPIVTTDAPGCRDLIEHEQTGLIVPRDDTASLANALSRLLSDTGLSRKLGGAAAREVDRHWHIQDMLATYADVYSAALPQP